MLELRPVHIIYSFLKFLLRSFGVFLEWGLILIISFALLITSPKFQTFLVNKIASSLFTDGISEVSVKQLNFGMDGRFSLKELHLKLDGFSLDIGNIECDLSFSSLLKSKFVGDSIYIDGVNIKTIPRVHPKNDTTPFSYSVVPYIQFNDVEIQNTNLYLAKVRDIDSLLFPRVHSSNFVFNDSIVADDLSYSNGYISFISDPDAVKGNVEKVEPHLLIPNGVPKFKLGSFKVDSLDVIFTDMNWKKVQKLGDLKMNIQGWSNTQGADLKLNQLAFNYQDTVAIEMNSDGLLLAADKEISINNFEIQTQLAYIDMRSLVIERKNHELSYAIDLKHGDFNPAILQLFPQTKGILKASEDKIKTSLLAKFNDNNLDINTLSVAIGNSSSIALHGNVQDVTHLKNVNLTTTEFNIATNDIHNTIGIELPDYLDQEIIQGKLIVEGNAQQLNSNIDLLVNSTQLGINGAIFDLLDPQKQSGHLSLKSPKVEFAKLMKDDLNNLTLYRPTAIVDLSSLKNISSNSFDVKIQSDSVAKNQLVLEDIKGNLIHANGKTSFLINSNEQNWSFQVETKDDIFKDKEISFRGGIDLNTITLRDSNYVNGEFKSKLLGNVSVHENKTAIECHFDDIRYNTDEGKDYEPSMADLFYQSTEASSEIKIFSQDIVDLRVNFENKLLEFLSEEVVNIPDVPNFSVNGSLSVDTNFMKSFANTPLGINIDQFNLKAENGKISGNSNIPYVSTNSVLAEGISLSMTKPNDFNQMDFSLLKLHTQIDDLSDLQLSVEVNDSINDAFVHLECVSKILEGKVSIPTEIMRSNLGLRVKLSDDEPIIIGSSPWIASPNSSMLISPSHYPSGYVSVTNEMQNISISASDDAVSLKIKDLLFDALISELANKPNTSAKLNTSIQYSYSQKEIEGRIDVTDIVSESTVLGDIAINIDADDSKQFADILYQENYGRLSGSVREFYSSPEFDLNLSNLNLESLQTLLNVDSNQIIMDGSVNGNFTGIYDSKLMANGQLEFTESTFRSNNFGVEGIIDQQVISITEDKISLTDFTIRNNLNQEVLMNGDFAFNNSLHHGDKFKEGLRDRINNLLR